MFAAGSVALNGPPNVAVPLITHAQVSVAAFAEAIGAITSPATQRPATRMSRLIYSLPGVVLVVVVRPPCRCYLALISSGASFLPFSSLIFSVDGAEVDSTPVMNVVLSVSFGPPWKLEYSCSPFDFVL